MNVNLRVCQVHVPHAPCRMLWHCNPRLGYWSQGREEVFSDFLRPCFQDILRLVHLRFFCGDSYDCMYGVGVNDIWCSILLCHVYSKQGEAEQSSQTKTFVSNLNLIHFFSSLNDKQLNYSKIIAKNLRTIIMSVRPRAFVLHQNPHVASWNCMQDMNK